MNQTNYSYSKKLSMSFQTAVEKTVEALRKEDFGVLTRVDVKEKMREKINKDMEEYIILGACHPESAYKVIQEEIEIGLLLPCNIIVYRKDEETHVAAIRPTQAMGMVDNGELSEVAEKIENKLKSVIKSI